MLDQLPGAFAAAFAVLFLSASLAKARRSESWIDLVRRAVPKPWIAPAVVVALPVAEALVGVGALVAPRVGLLAAAGLLSALALAAMATMRRVEGMSCSCFGSLGRSTLGPRLVIRNVLLAALAGVASQLVSMEPSQVEVLEALVLAATVLAIVRVRRPARRLPFAVGDPGRRVVVVLGADCPACHELAARIADVCDAARVDALSVVIVGGSRTARLALERAVDGVARLEDESQAQAIAAESLPWAVVTDETGRIVDARPAGNWLGVERGSSRRSFLLRGATLAGLMWLTQSAPVLAAGSRKARRGNPYTEHHLPQNDFSGDCKAFQDYIAKTGTYAPRFPGDTPTKHPRAEGHTAGFPTESDRIVVQASPGAPRRFEAKKGICTCPGRVRYYESLTECTVKCPTGLNCFTWHCRESGRVCFEQDVTITIPTPKVGVWVARWTPDNDAPGCQAAAAAEYRRTLSHEEHHVDDTYDILDTARQRYGHSVIVGCGADDAGAMDALRDHQNQLVEAIQNDIAREQAARQTALDTADPWPADFCDPCLP